MYNIFPFKQLILLLHWVLVTIEEFLAGLGLGDEWTWGLAIIGLTIIVRLILFPLTWKQYRHALSLQALQPKMKELQRRHKEDRNKLQAETMKLYQEHRVNPFASCLPLLLQLPVFIALYAAIKGLGPLSITDPTVAALNSASFLWIPQLGEPDPYYILLVLYVVSQFISTELMLATQSDKMQKMMMRAMPLFFVIFLWNFPAGLFVYWVTSNVWTIGQQLLIKKAMKPVDLSTVSSQPRKRSRIVDALVAAQGQSPKDKAGAQNKGGSAAQAGKQSQAKKPAGASSGSRSTGQQAAGKGKTRSATTRANKPGQPRPSKPAARTSKPATPSAEAPSSTSDASGPAGN
jgi:YidC/Oxa1 family membrane protein insertase